MKYIDIPIFLLSLAVGLFFVYTSTNSQTKDVYVFPNPDNIEQIQYMDKGENCFAFDPVKTSCNGKERLYEVQ